MSFITLLLYIIVIYIRPQEWVPPMLGWPLVDIFAISTAFFLILEISQRKKVHITEPQNMLLLCFLGSIVLSHIAHTYAWAAWDSFLKFGRNVVMFFLFVNVLTSKNKLRISIWLIVILTVILAIEGIFQYRNGYGWAGQLPMISKERIRIRWIGIFNDPNDLALAFVVAIGFLLSFIFGSTSLFVKIVSVPFIGILMYSLRFTNSRGGYLALAATTVYYFLRRIKKKFFAVIIGVLLAITVIAIGPSRLSDLSPQEASASGRIEAWYQGFQMLKTSPLFGVGYGMFMDYHERTAHNSYILVAAEEGLFGLLIWVALIYFCFKTLHLLQSKSNELRPYTMGLEVGLFGFLSASYFLSRAYIPLFYILLALASAFAYTLLKAEDYKFSSRDIKIAGALSAGILFVTWLSMRVSLRLFG